jgi:hypothetical protein
LNYQKQHQKQFQVLLNQPIIQFHILFDWGLYGLGYNGLWGSGYYGLYGKRDVEEVPQELLNRTECYFNVERELIRCQGPTGQTECETELWADLEEPETVFGVVFDNSTLNSYRLIARKLDNTAWISTKWISETTGVPTYPTLFFGESPESIGLRIKDETCFTEIAEIFKGSNRYERVMVEDEETPVVVIGDIMTVTDKEQPQPEQPQPKESFDELRNIERLTALEKKFTELESTVDRILNHFD